MKKRLITPLITALLITSANSYALSQDDKYAADRIFDLAEAGRWSESLGAASSAQDAAVKKLGKWYFYLKNGQNAEFSEIAAFIKQNPTWPRIEEIKKKAEQSLYNNPSSKAAYQWFQGNQPITGHGKLAYVQSMEAVKGGAAWNDPKMIPYVREAWEQVSFDRAKEDDFRANYGKYLRKEDHHKKLDWLIWKEEFSSANRLLSLADDSHEKLYSARIKLLTSHKTAEAAMNAVPKSMQSDPGLLYARMKWRESKGMDSGVREMLTAAPNPPYPEKWWKSREKQAQKMLESRNFKAAYNLVNRHGLSEGESFARAEFMSGWIALSFLNDPRSAYKHFYHLYTNLKYPVSLSRAAYWAGRAAKANKNADIAANWFGIAAGFPTTFHGQLALNELGKPFPELKDTPKPSKDQYAAFKRQELPSALVALNAAGRDDLMKIFLAAVAENAKSPAEHEMMAMLGAEMKRPEVAVRAAKSSFRENVVLVDSGYPTFKFNPDENIEKALVLAITRQESEFNPRAKSASNAIGLMQLLPSTAAHVGKKMGIGGVGAGQLTNPDLNLRLGSRYISDMVDNYGGSYVLAVASYNAGPGRVRQWLKTYGDPRHGKISMIDWIEIIPFDETRTYVHRVLENLQVYRHLLASEGGRTLQHDLGA